LKFKCEIQKYPFQFINSIDTYIGLYKYLLISEQIRKVPGRYAWKYDIVFT